MVCNFSCKNLCQNVGIIGNYLDYDHLYIPLPSEWDKLQRQTIFLGNNNSFLLSLLLYGSRFLKKHINIFGWNLFIIFKVGEVIGWKNGHLMLPGAFPDKIYSWYWFCRWSCSAVWHPSYTNTIVCTCNLQMITNKFWFKCLCTVSGPNFLYSFSFLGSWSI